MVLGLLKAGRPCAQPGYICIYSWDWDELVLEATYFESKSICWLLASTFTVNAHFKND